VSSSHYFSRNVESAATENARVVKIEARGSKLRMQTSAGTFSRGGLDEGSAILLEHCEIASGSRVLDLGCGWGAVGCIVADRVEESRVAMCDINLRAAHLALENARLNGLRNVCAWCGDGADAASDQTFDVVLLNPPVRAGNDVMQKLFNDALRVLRSGGVLWIVLRTAQGAKTWQKRLQNQWGNCETVTIEKGYRIFRCVKS
jgi:16S rRNA (guanine1207-N2)-methyltransferase